VTIPRAQSAVQPLIRIATAPVPGCHASSCFYEAGYADLPHISHWSLTRASGAEAIRLWRILVVVPVAYLATNFPSEAGVASNTKNNGHSCEQ
jgi:hypothetical protein